MMMHDSVVVHCSTSISYGVAHQEAILIGLISHQLTGDFDDF